MLRLEYSDPRFRSKLKRFLSRQVAGQQVPETVSAILARVRAEGDPAVSHFTREFDGIELAPRDFRVSGEALKAGRRSLTVKQRKGIREAIRMVEDFHREGLPKPWMARNAHGARVGERWYPLRRVGLYIPGGAAPLISTVVMTATLARVAGVKEIAACSPPGRDGDISPQMKAAFDLCGVNEVYRIGGVQAIGAMAYGTRTIPAVDKVMGPGNAYTTEAQRQVFGQVGVALLPGPSEVLAFADATAREDYLAADLLAQAEHGSGWERVFLVHMDDAQADRVWEAMQRQVEGLGNAGAIRKVMKSRLLFVRVENVEEAIELINEVAPEHLELHVEKALCRRLLKEVHSAGSILCGHETPTVMGDFTAGPSHTLPTGGTGRFFSGLQVLDFMRRSSVVEYTPRAVRAGAEVVRVFSELEGLDAHGRSLEIRLEDEHE